MGRSETNGDGMATGGRVRPIDTVPGMLRQYEKYVTVGLDHDDYYDTEALLALILRDGIEEQWDELDEAQREEVYRLDGILASKHERVSDILPSGVEHDRTRWWWFLHEGPQVRERASSRHS